MAKQNGFNLMYAYECIEGMEWNGIERLSLLFNLFNFNQ